MTFPLAAVPNRDPDIIVIEFTDSSNRSLTVRRTYKEAAKAIINDGDYSCQVDQSFARATAFWLEAGEILPVDVTNRIEAIADDICEEDRREVGYERDHNDSLRHPA